MQSPAIAARELLLQCGKEDCTEAIRTAIDALAALGGGRLRIPPGVWKTGAVHLQSGIELHLERGAELRFRTDPQAYLPVVYQQRGGVRCFNYSPFVYARNCRDVAITGEGMLNGQGGAWWPWKFAQPGMFRLLEMGKRKTPLEERVFGTVEDGVRPDFIQFIDCQRVMIEGVTVKDGPAWQLHPVCCDDVIIRRVSVIGHGHNNDGIDPDGCRNVLIEHCLIDAGDDSICIKSGRDQDAWEVGRPCENVLIRHCKIVAGHGAITIGSETSGGVHNVYAHDIDAEGTFYGISIKTRRGRGGVIENILVENVQLDKIRNEAIVLNMEYGDESLGEQRTTVHRKDETTPTLRNITFRNVICHSAHQTIRSVGLSENPITGLKLENLALSGTLGDEFRYTSLN